MLFETGIDVGGRRLILFTRHPPLNFGYVNASFSVKMTGAVGQSSEDGYYKNLKTLVGSSGQELWAVPCSRAERAFASVGWDFTPLQFGRQCVFLCWFQQFSLILAAKGCSCMVRSQTHMKLAWCPQFLDPGK